MRHHGFGRVMACMLLNYKITLIGKYFQNYTYLIKKIGQKFINSITKSLSYLVISTSLCFVRTLSDVFRNF